MKFTKVSYSKTYPLQQFSNEKPFVEIELQDGENPLEALKEAKKLLDEFHNLNISQEDEKQVTLIPKEKNNKETIKQRIDECRNRQELEEWNYFVSTKGNEDLKMYYDIKKALLR